MSRVPGTPNNAQCLWLTSRLQPIRALFRQFGTCSTVEELKVVLCCVQTELDNTCVEFASLVWARSRQALELVPTCGPLPELTSPTSDSLSSERRPSAESDSVGADLDAPVSNGPESEWTTVVLRKRASEQVPGTPPSIRQPPTPTKSPDHSPVQVRPPKQPVKHRPCVRKLRRMIKKGRHGTNALNLSHMSKAEHTRRFGKKKSGKKKKTTNFVRVVSHKDLVQYLAGQSFVLTNESRSSDWRYERNVCGCGQCPIFQPVPTCDSHRQIASIAHPSSKTKKNYYRNKRMDVDKLTEQARAEYATYN